MSRGECQAKLPRQGVSTSDLTLEEIAGLQCWSVADIEENRSGKLSQHQQERLMEGRPDLFGLVHARVASKKAIRHGVVDVHEGVLTTFQSATFTGPSMVLELDGDERYFWSDPETSRGTPESHAVMALRYRLLEDWAARRRRVRIYALSFHVVAFEPVEG